MAEIRYSVAEERDIPFINRTYTENIDSLHGVIRSDDVWKRLLSEKDTLYYIVYNPMPVAWFRIDLEDGAFWLGMLQVRPMYQRRGIGKFILSAAETIAAGMGYPKIGIHTTEDNAAARALYVSMGYTVTQIGPCTTADGKERVGYTFEKEVNR